MQCDKMHTQGRAGHSAQKDDKSSALKNLCFGGKGKGRQNSRTISQANILSFLVGLLAHFVPIYMQGKTKLQDVYRLVVKAAVTRSSIEDVGTSTKRGPAARTLRYHLQKLKLKALEKAITPLLHYLAKPMLVGKKLIIVLDFKDVPYHGEPQEDGKEIRRSKAKNGTTHFHAYATAYVVLWNMRFTIALRYVRGKETTLEVVKYLLEKIDLLDIEIKKLLLDKEFYEVRAINFLKAEGIPFLSAVPMRGERLKGLRQRHKGSRSFNHTLKNKHGETATVLIHLVQKYTKGRYKRSGAVWFAYAAHKVGRSTIRTYERYRKRFGIESSYRMMDDCRARTTSRSPERRLLYVLVAFLIINIRVYVEWLRKEDKRRSSRRGHQNIITLKRLKRGLRKAVNKIYGEKDLEIVYQDDDNRRKNLIKRRTNYGVVA